MMSQVFKDLLSVCFEFCQDLSTSARAPLFRRPRPAWVLRIAPGWPSAPILRAKARQNIQFQPTEK